MSLTATNQSINTYGSTITPASYQPGEFMSMIDESTRYNATNLQGGFNTIDRNTRLNPINSMGMEYRNTSYQGAQLSAQGFVSPTRMINNNYSGQGFGSTYDNSYSSSGYIQYDN